MVAGLDVIHSFGVQDLDVKLMQYLEGAWYYRFFKKKRKFYGHAVNCVEYSMVYANCRRVGKSLTIREILFVFSVVNNFLKIMF